MIKDHNDSNATILATADEYVNEIYELAKTKGATFVYALFKEVATFNNVSVKVPSLNGRFMKEVPKNIIWVPEDEDLKNEPMEIHVGKHYRYGDFCDGKLVFRNFYKVEPANLGQTILADVKILIKRDLYRHGEESLILDITQIRTNGVPTPAEWRLKIGADRRDADSWSRNFKIPGTSKDIRFEKCQKN